MTIAPQPFDVDVDASIPGQAVVRLRGELDVGSAPELSACLAALDEVDVVVDMSGLTFMDSSGISALIEAYKRCSKGGLSFVLRSPSAQVANVLRITGVDQVLTVERSDGGS
jgi:anti-sigma B factor antagonist